MNQTEIEHKYSRKHIRARIKEDVDQEHAVFDSMVRAITVYRSGTYYTSKQDRVNAIKLTSSEIASEILAVVLPITTVSPIQSVATLVGKHLGFKELLDSIKTAAELVAVCEESGAYVIYHSQDDSNDTGTLGIKSNYKLEPETADFIAGTKYLPPMIEKPLNWTTNNNGGYFTGSGSVILGALNNHKEEQSLDVINILQDIEWSLCEMVDYVEKSKKPLDTNDKVVQFTVMQKQSTIVYNELLAEGNKFYFTWKYDARGRMYSQGYHCNLQSTEYKKSIINFKHEELIK